MYRGKWLTWGHCVCTVQHYKLHYYSITLFKPSPLSVSAAHVLAWEWIRKPDGRISCQNEGWVTFYTHDFLFASLSNPPVLILLVHFGCFRPRWLCTAVCWWPVRGEKCKHKHVDLSFDILYIRSHQLFLALLGPNALRATTLEATRPRGSQQQADMGQWRVYLFASRHRTAVNQGD